MYNGLSVNVTDGPLCNVVHLQYAAIFLITLFELNLDRYIQ